MGYTKLSLRFVVVLLCCSASFMMAQESTSHYWIVLPKKETPASVSPQAIGISERALHRRAKSLPSDQLIDEYDYPVSSSAIAQIESCGVTVRFASRWLNAVSVVATPKQVQTLSAIPSAKIVSVKKMVRRSVALSDTVQTISSLSKTSSTTALQKTTSATTLDYGSSAKQLSNIKVTDLHALGVIGSGVIIGMLDDGFNNYRTHPALTSINIIATHDFIHNIDNVNRQSWETSTQGDHGEGTLSAAGGYAPGSMIGAAYGASFILAKTEMDSSGSYDYHSEEDTYVAALEWMEQLGVDITSSSLAYKEFSDTTSNGTGSYTWQQLDGRTTKVAQAAIIAARKGVLVVTAMGNEGYQYGNIKSTDVLHADTTLWSPADADSILAVGATASDFELASFSGCGPTADGRIKPDIIAQGLGVYWASGTSSYASVNGTSCSTPLVAGAAALILSANPTWNAQQVRSAILKTAVQYNDGTTQTATYPNNYYGYGVINALSAAQYNTTSVAATTPSTLKVYPNFPNPFNNGTIIKFDMPAAGIVNIDVYNVLGQHVKTIYSGTAAKETIQKTWNGANEQGRAVSSGVYIYRIMTNGFSESHKMLFLK
jgi:serine protease AprX